MIDDNYKNDFFGEELNHKGSEKSAKLKNYSGQRFLPYIRIPIEYVVIIAIGVLMLAIVSYAVGVERGKRLEGGKTVPFVSEESIAFDQQVNLDASIEISAEEGEIDTQEDVSPQEIIEAETEELLTEGILEGLPRAPEAEEEEEQVVESIYIIQLAAFKSEDAAEEEKDELKDEGVIAEVSQSGDWYQVYAAGYQTITEAKQAQKKLIENYEDCYIKKVR